MKMNEPRKQFRMYTLYKAIVDGLHDEVKHIVTFKTDDKYVIVKFSDGDSLQFLINDFRAKQVAIKHINRKLKELKNRETNCNFES